MAKNWYILMSFTGFEKKVERTIRTYLDKGELDSAIVTDVRVPEEEVVEVKDGKKRTRKDKFLPGYVMVEMDLPEFDWKTTCTKIRRIQGVGGFVGTNPKERPRPISAAEAKNLLMKAGAIKGEMPIKVKTNYNVGDLVKIIDGPFKTFSGNIEEINADKDKLVVNVQIFGRATPVDVSLSQVEKA